METKVKLSAREKTLESLKFTRKEKVRVMPIIRKNEWLPENHDGEFLNQGAKLDIVVPHQENKDHLVDPLNHLDPTQKGKLAKKLGLTGAEDLNPLKIKDNYWKNRHVTLKREGLILDTSDPYDYIRLCILLSDSDRIAPTWENRNDKFTYKFAVVRESDENKEEERSIDIKRQAYNLYDDVAEDLDALEAILWIRYYEKHGYKKPPAKPTHKWAKVEIGKMIENKPQDFVDIVGQENYETKYLVQKALKQGHLVREGQQIRFKSSANLLGLFDEVVTYLDDERHAEDKRILQEKVDNDSKPGNK
jgi:hypothetical protein